MRSKRVTSFSCPHAPAGQRRSAAGRCSGSDRRRHRSLGDVVPGEQAAHRSGPARRPRWRRTTRASRRGRRRRRSCRGRRAPSRCGSAPSVARSGTLATALLPGRALVDPEDVLRRRPGRATAWMAVSSPAARMRGFSRPGDDGVGGRRRRALRRHLPDAVASPRWRSCTASSPSTQRGALSRTAPKRPPSNLRLDAVERVAR